MHRQIKVELLYEPLPLSSLGEFDSANQLIASQSCCPVGIEKPPKPLKITKQACASRQTNTLKNKERNFRVLPHLTKLHFVTEQLEAGSCYSSRQGV